MEKGKCRTCNADIWWAITGHSGKPIPLNAEFEMRLVPVTPGSSVVEVRQVYVSHFATCPDAEQFRKG